ncbi:acyl-CoA dehydrogenase family protein [soil metagenome]
MDFTFDANTEEFAEATRRFCEERIVPQSPKWDQGVPVDKSVYADMGKLGLLSARMPEEFGGLGLSFVSCGRLAYEVGRADVGVSLMFVNAVMWGELAHLMHPSIREKWTPRVAGGSPFVFTLTEPGAGSDAGSIRTTAKRDGDFYVINGEKATVTHCGTGDIAVVFARTGGPGPKGISAFMVPWDSPGIEKTIYKSAGERVTQRGQAFYTDLRVPAINLLGAEGGGFREAMQFFDYNRAFLALACIGAAERSLDDMITHIQQRHTFGQPLMKNQGVTFQIAEHMTRLESAKLLAYKVLSMKDTGQPHSKEAAMIKAYGINQAFKALHTCVILSGWPAYSSDIPHEQRMRDVMGLEIGDGTPEIMKMIVAREVFGRESLPYRRTVESQQ